MLLVCVGAPGVPGTGWGFFLFFGGVGWWLSKFFGERSGASSGFGLAQGIAVSPRVGGGFQARPAAPLAVMGCGDGEAPPLPQFETREEQTSARGEVRGRTGPGSRVTPPSPPPGIRKGQENRFTAKHFKPRCSRPWAPRRLPGGFVAMGQTGSFLSFNRAPQQSPLSAHAFTLPFPRKRPAAEGDQNSPSPEWWRAIWKQRAERCRNPPFLLFTS